MMVNSESQTQSRKTTDTECQTDAYECNCISLEEQEEVTQSFKFLKLEPCYSLVEFDVPADYPIQKQPITQK